MEEHKATIARAKAASPKYLVVWTGDIRRNPYLEENIRVMEFLDVATITLDDSDEQESNYIITWK